jgi:hypothetical protein
MSSDMTKRQSVRRRSARRRVVGYPALDDASHATSARKGGNLRKRKRGGIAAGKKPGFRADKPRRSGGGSVQAGPVAQNLPPPLTDEQKKATRERVDRGLENAGRSLSDIGAGMSAAGRMTRMIPGGQPVGTVVGRIGAAASTAGRVLTNPDTRAPITAFTTDQANAETERLIDSASQAAGEEQLIDSHANSLGF